LKTKKKILVYTTTTFCSVYSGGGSLFVGNVEIDAGIERSINKGSSRRDQSSINLIE
jgi:hypothetical protein